MSVASHCRRPASTVERDESIHHAAERMDRERVGSLVVVEEGRPVGILTDRDVALRVVAKNLHPRTTRVGDVVGGQVLTVSEDLPLKEASAEMRRHGVRRMPVVNPSGRVVGMLAADDLVRIISRELTALADVAMEQVPVEERSRPECWRSVEHYTRDVTTAPLAAPVREVAERMRDESIGSMVVEDEDGKPCGIVTDRDLTVLVVARGLNPEATPVSDIMSPSLITVDGSLGILEVAQTMSQNGVRRVPVTSEGRLVGIVTYDDLLVTLGRELHDLGRAAAGAMEREFAANTLVDESLAPQ